MAWSSDSPDEDLMQGYCAGDAGAFELLYRRHRGGVYRYLLRQSRNGAAAEELAQDVWMNLVRARSTYVPSAKFTTYLYRLAHNRLIDHYRKHAGRAMLSYDDDGGAPVDDPPAPRADEPDAQYDSRRRAQRLVALLEALPEAQREAFVLQQEGGLSVEEIASATGVTRETAKSRLRYAVAKLRQGMGDWE